MSGFPSVLHLLVFQTANRRTILLIHEIHNLELKSSPHHCFVHRVTNGTLKNGNDFIISVLLLLEWKISEGNSLGPIFLIQGSLATDHSLRRLFTCPWMAQIRD